MYISYLIDSPGREIHCQQLLSASNGIVIENVFGQGGVQSDAESGQTENVAVSNAPLIDEKALKKYKNHIHKLREEIEEAEKNKNFSRKEFLEKEYEFLQKEIISASGISGKVRDMADESEKARKSVSAAYRRALKIIQKEDSSLYSHLKNSIQMGEYCMYQPEEKIFWTISKN